MLDLDRNTAVAFEHIAFGRHLRDLRAWLSGDSLPEAALERMDLAQDEGTDEEREDQSRQIVLMLCRLAGNGLPVVISFDQVEALQITPGDRDAVFAFGQVTSTLHDSTTNVLVVSCVQSAFNSILLDHARKADLDRMSSLGAWTLQSLTREEGLQLIQARLSQLDPAESSAFPTSPGWPLDPDELKGLFAKGSPISPRQLLSLCAERFETWVRRSKQDVSGIVTPAGEPDKFATATVEDDQTGDRPSKTDTVDAFFQEKWATDFEQKRADSTPERTEEIVRHGLPMLVKLVTPEVQLVNDELLPDVSLVFETNTGRTGVGLCTQANMTSLAARLKRLKAQQATGRLQRLVVVRDGRVPVSAGAKKAQQLLMELEQHKAVVLYPSVEALAALDALRDLLSDAKSGDLSWHGGTIAPQSLEDWLVANLATGLQDLVDDVLGRSGAPGDETVSDTRDVEALNTLLATRPLLPLEEAVEALQRPADVVTAIAERHPDRFRMLSGPPAMLYRAEDTQT